VIRRPSAEGALTACLLLLLGAGIVYPLLEILRAAVVADGRPTAAPLLAVFERPPFREALVNTLVAGVLVAALGSVIAVPLALLTARYRFPGRRTATALGLLPLVIPPFVGAIAFRQMLGPIVEGFRGVVLVQACHYFPFIWLNTTMALSTLNPSLEEAAENLGSSGFRLFRRVLLPLTLPGYAAGVLLTFIRAVDDLGTPLMLGYTDLLAPQAFVRVTTAGLGDAEGYVICIVLMALSLCALWISRGLLGRGEFTSLGMSGDAPPRALGAGGRLAAWALVVVLLGPALLPQTGIALLSVAKEWSLSPLPSAYTLSNFDEILLRAPRFIWNTLRYAVLATAVDMGLGAVLAWLILRGRTRGRQWLDALATMPLALPGVVLAIGYLRAFHGWTVPGMGAPLTATWLVLAVVYAVRRLPYTVRGACAGLEAHPVALEEAAQGLGARRARAFVKVTLPLMARGLLAGGALAFVISAVDFSSTILLVPRAELAPLSYGVYFSMQSAAERGPGAALGVLAIALVAAGAWAATRLARRGAGPSRV